MRINVPPARQIMSWLWGLAASYRYLHQTQHNIPDTFLRAADETMMTFREQVIRPNPGSERWTPSSTDPLIIARMIETDADNREAWNKFFEEKAALDTRQALWRHIHTAANIFIEAGLDTIVPAIEQGTWAAEIAQSEYF